VKNKELNFKQADVVTHSIFLENRASNKNTSKVQTNFTGC
jgi:hypothetical protein